ASSQQTDSLVKAYDPSGEVALALVNLQKRLETRRAFILRKLDRQSAALRESDRKVTKQIDLLLLSFQEEEALAAGKQEAARHAFVAKAGQQLALIAGLALLLIPISFFLILREIGKARRLSRERDQARRRAEELLLAREQFMLMLSHDIRAPLSSVIGYIDLLRQPASKEEKEGFLKDMDTSAKHVLALANELLHFHRLDAGQVQLESCPYRPAEIRDELLREYRPLAEARNLHLASERGAAVEGLRCLGDAQALRQIVGNLLSNAIKFASHEVHLYFHVEAAGENIFSRLCLGVKDDGPGIAPEQVRKIFQAFTRLDNAKATDGFGLGLAIAGKLANLMGGEIRVESAIGKGSTFILRLPLTLSEEEPALESKPQTSLTPTSPTPTNSPAATLHEEAPRLNLLLVDDDPVQLKYGTTLLRRQGVNVVACPKVSLVLELLAAGRFDLLITDIRMPGADGYSLLQSIRGASFEKAASLPVVALSAGMGEAPSAYLEKGFAAYLEKPLRADTLQELLNRLFPDKAKAAPSLTASEKDPSHIPDFGALTSYADGPEEAANILRSFREETKKNLDTLKTALAAQDRQAAARTAHKMRPLVKLLGIGDLAACLEVIEANRGGKKQWIADMENALRQTEALYARIPAA
ncbi:MAG: response regulator, partial [Tannerella sp.]|nr:response regulator [Tannerella sp.]